MMNAFIGSPEDLPDFHGGVTSMLSPDECGETAEERECSLPGGGVAVSGKELRQMLDIITAVHRCWQDNILPEAIEVPYRAYSASSGVNMPHWPWRNFKPEEIACPCCGETHLDRAAMDALQRLRDSLGRPIRLTSAHRCEKHNRAVGGAKASRHLKLAFDCACPAALQTAFADAAKQAGFRGVIRYPKRGFVHLDCRVRRYEAEA